MNLFTDGADRAKAMGLFGFVSAGGGSIGVLLGGLLVGTYDWHWIFLINVPVGIAVVLLTFWLVPGGRGTATHRHLDAFGAITITAALMLATYAIVGGNDAGWLSTQTLEFLGGALALFAIFIFLETRVKAPLMPLSLFKIRSVTISNIAGVLWAAAMFAWFFISTLYLQSVLRLYTDAGGARVPPGKSHYGRLLAWTLSKNCNEVGHQVAFGCRAWPCSPGLGAFCPRTTGHIWRRAV
jgi:MFS family permease